MDNNDLIQATVDLSTMDWFTDSSQLLFLALAGSRAHGLNKPDADYDIVGVVLPPPENIIGLGRWESFHSITENLDIRLYSPKKFLTLMDQGGVTNLELLFLKPLIRHSVLRPLFYARGDLLQPVLISSILGHSTSTLGRFRDISRAKLGSKRRGYIETHGYDVSAAVHACRWLRMGLKLLQFPKHLQVVADSTEQHMLSSIKLGNEDADTVERLIRRMQMELEANRDSISAKLGQNIKPDLSRMLVDIHRKLLI